MCASPVTRCVSCVPVQAHNGRLTASCVGMLHASQRGVWRAATLLLVRRQMFCSSNFLTEELLSIKIVVLYIHYAVMVVVE